MVRILSIFLNVVTDTAAGVSLWHTLAMHKDDPKNTPVPDKSLVDDNPPEDSEAPKEIGGRGGLDPTRYGDWEKAGRCIDF
jgi:hypothetical protein